jgi:hypothetical protein
MAPHKVGFYRYRFSESTQKSNFMSECPVDDELFHADRQTGRHYEASSRFSQFRALAYKFKAIYIWAHKGFWDSTSFVSRRFQLHSSSKKTDIRRKFVMDDMTLVNTQSRKTGTRQVLAGRMIFHWAVTIRSCQCNCIWWEKGCCDGWW